MKKLYTFLVIILALFTGVIFSACKNNFRFSMDFYLGNSRITELNLFIDSSGNTTTQQVSIKFSRLKSNKIDPIDIYVDQSDVAYIDNKVKNGTTYNFNITALAPTSDANIVVRHINSNKKASIKLNIEKQSSYVNSLNKIYVAAIPTEDSVTTQIDASKILSYDGSETVYYSLAGNSTLPQGVTPIYLDGSSIITKFEISSNTVSGSSVNLNPVLYIKDINTEPNTDIVVQLNFLSLLTDDNVNLHINNRYEAYQSDAYQSNYEQNLPITLLYNDENFKTIQVNYDFGSNDYAKYYKNPQLKTLDGLNANTLGLSSFGEGNKYVISAQSVIETSTVKFAFEPNDVYVGEISTYNKSLLLASKKRATDIEISQDDEVISGKDLNNVNIFNKYYDNLNSERLGSKFNFTPNGQDGGIDEFNYMRITLPGNMLHIEQNVFSTHEFDEEGNETFSNLLLTGNNFETNANLLQIYLGPNPMRFYYDTSSGKLISEEFLKDSNIYIKYCKNTSGGELSQASLKIDVETIYKYMGSNFGGNYAYFNNSTPKPNGGKTITFSAQDGINDVGLNAGYFENGVVTEYNGEAEHLAINRTDESTYALKISTVSGADDVAIENTNFDMSILPLNGQTNAVKFKIGNTGEELSYANYTYTANVSSSDINRFIYLVVNSADLGYYNLSISHANGYTLTVPIFVYEDVDESDLAYEINLTEGLDFTSKQDYDADYLVPEDENRQLALYVENKSKFNLTYNDMPFYSFADLDLEMKYANEQDAGQIGDVTEFVSKNNFSNFDVAFGNLLTFKKASYFNGKNYVVATLGVKSNFSFANIIAEAAQQNEYSTTKKITFYIYKKFDENLLTMQFSTRDVYFADYLSYNSTKTSQTNLNLTYQNGDDIWNYIDEVSWACDRANEVGTSYTLKGEKSTAELQFLKHTDNNYFTFSASITQFGVRHNVTVSLAVKTPIITTDLSVNNVNYDYDENFFLDMQAGKSLEINYTATANGETVNPDVEIYVVRRVNDAGRTQFEISTGLESVNIVGNQIFAKSSEQNLSLLVVAADVLKSELSGTYNELSEIVSKFINPNEDVVNPYVNAYKIVDLYITDGDSTETAFIIDSADDFVGINDYAGAEKYFVLINNINLSGVKTPITNFSGHLTSLSGYNFSLNSLELNSDMPNLFDTINQGATISNINIDVKFDYSNLSDANLGIIGENNGKLTDVNVNFSGIANIKNKVNFGVLVGNNKGEITYTTTRNASYGQIELTGDGEVVFGGLVGLNEGSITGKKFVIESESGQDNVVFANSVFNGATADVKISSSLTNSQSAIGGLIGKNKGKLETVLVCGTIKATYNVGGIIGINESEQKTAQITYNRSEDGDGITNISFTENNFEIKQAISQVIISGTNNVGGVVGSDLNGRYYNCAYQIYQPNQTSITGENAVGGFAGCSQDGWFSYCYVMSYRWNYQSLNSIQGKADIIGSSEVAGFVGKSTSSWSTLQVDQTNTTAALIISNTSVNAYIGALNEQSTTAGLTNVATTGNTHHSAIANAYFLGRIDGKFTEDSSNSLVLTNIESSAGGEYTPIYGKVYSLYYKPEQSSTQLGSYPNNFHPEESVDNETWGKDSSQEINGGHAYLLLNNKPLFELAPTSVLASTKEKTDIYSAYKLDEKTIYLNYYDFNLNENEERYQDTYNRLQEKFNTYSILDLFNLSCLPKDIKILQLNATEIGNCVKIIDGNLVVCGVGEAQLTFTSLVNQNAQDNVKIIVGYPFGNYFSLKENVTSTRELELFSVGKNQTREVAISFEGKKALSDHNTKTYEYQTSTNVQYNLTASLSETDAELKESFNKFMQSSLFIGGINFKEEDGVWKAIVNNLTINVKDEFKGNIIITVQPIIEINWQNDETSHKEILKFPTQKQFNLTTLVGATAVQMQSKGGVVYPNTVLDGANSFEVDILTDFAYSENQLNFVDELAELKIYVYIDGDMLQLNDETLKNIIDFEVNSEGKKFISYNDEQQKQTLKFKIKFAEFEKIIEQSTLWDKSQAHKILFEFVINKKMGSVVYNLAPQQIYDINIRNYVVNFNDEPLLKENSLLYLGEYGAIIIDMFPQNGYFDFLEIRDITVGADALIKFVQVNQNLRKDNTNIGDDIETADGIGIELNKNAFEEDNFKIYALTQILTSQLEIAHQIEVIAYVGTRTNKIEVGRNVLEIQIRLQPEVNVNYLKPDGSVYLTADNSNSNISSEIAYGTNVQFRVDTQHVEELRSNISFVNAGDLNINDYYSLTQQNGGYYRLNSIKLDERLIGKEIVIKFTGVRVTNAGEEITTETRFVLKIAQFKVFGVSILNNSRRIGDKLEVYGNLNNPVDIEFYFAETDVSYYKYKNTQFRYNNQYDDAGATALVNILKQLNGINGENSVDISEILKWYPFATEQQPEVEAVDEAELVMSSDGKINDYNIVVTRNNKPLQLLVKQNYKIGKFELKFNLIDDGNGFKKVQPVQKTEEGLDMAAEFSIEVQLNFNPATPIFDAELVENTEKFYAMAGADSRYILGCDLTFDESDPYVPFDLDVANFDGNGHTIKISSFALPEGNTINAGLFTTISSTTVVQNLQVEYNLGDINMNTQLPGIRKFAYLGDKDIKYDSINFGGIAVRNEGVITNCKVKGSTVFSTNNINIDAITQQDSKNISPFNIGGIAYINEATAFITNTISELKIIAMANTGAFVHTNNGTITSSYFNAGNSLETEITNGFMYIYQVEPPTDNLGNVVDLNATSAAFVVNNTSLGKIEMSYVQSGITNELGNLSANNNYSGFVFNNAGEISNSYTNIIQIGRSEDGFAGFVYNNSSGTIQNCYTYVNEGANLGRQNFAFASTDNNGNLQNCYTIKNSDTQIGEESPLVKIILKSNLIGDSNSVASQFKGFIFGDFMSSVWDLTRLDSIVLPQLSATKETIEFTNLSQPEILDDVIHYYGWKDVDVYENRKEIILKDDGSKQNPYVIYNAEIWNTYFSNERNQNGFYGYYRLVADIDFNSTSPSTSDKVFAGNIQGNGLKITNFALNTKEDLSSIGLFSELKGEQNNFENNAIRNLTIQNVNIKAIKTQAVGVLAGIISNYKIYNISLESDDILLGENVVGGLAGIITDRFDIEKVSSNISALNDYTIKTGNYEVYTSKINNLTPNLSNVYYAGSVAGIVDAIPLGTDFNLANRSIDDGYSIRNIDVFGNVLLISNTVGAAFGLINEYTILTDVNVVFDSESTSRLSGYQYSAGIVGENRGVIKRAYFESKNDAVFNSARATAAGVVGLNLGYIESASAKFNEIRYPESANDNRYINTILSGLVGRNAEGYLVNSSFDGNIISAWTLSSTIEITAGAIGSDYSLQSLAGEGINQTLQNGVFAQFRYYNPSAAQTEILHIKDVTISKNAIDFWLDNLDYAYQIKADDNSKNPFNISTGRILAAAIGFKLSNDSNLYYGFNSDGFVINYTSDGGITKPQFGALEDVNLYNDELTSTPFANAFNYATKENDKVYILNALGSYVTSFDYWEQNNYTCEMMLLGNNVATKLKSISIDASDATIYRISTNLSSLGNIAYTIYSNLSALQLEEFTLSIDLFFAVKEEVSVTGGTIGEGSPSGTVYSINITDSTSITITYAPNKQMILNFN